MAALPIEGLDARFTVKKTALFSVIDPLPQKQIQASSSQSRGSLPSSTGSSELQNRLQILSEKLKEAESRIQVLEELSAGKAVPLDRQAPVVRVRQSCRALGVSR